MKRKLLPHPVLTVTLWLVWLLLNNTLAAGHIILGAILAILIPWFSAGFWQEHVQFRKPLSLLKFVLLVIYDIVVANVAVARLILLKQETLQPGFITIPLDVRSPIAISLLANTISLTPGTVTCDLSGDRTHLLIHGLNITDADATIRDIKKRYEHPLKEIFD